MIETAKSVAHWRIITAFLLDALCSLIVIGYAVAAVTGQTTEDGFQLKGWPALVSIAIVIAYFIIGRQLGGTVFQRLLGTR